jgi:hypothetical protein
MMMLLQNNYVNFRSFAKRFFDNANLEQNPKNVRDFCLALAQRNINHTPQKRLEKINPNMFK